MYPPWLLGLSLLLGYLLFKLAKFAYREYASPISDLPGPSSPSWIWGNLKEIWESDNSAMHDKWISSFGPTIKYKGLFGMTRLYTTDTKALNHVLMSTHIYQKPEAARYNLTRLLGAGLLVTEGEKHKQQNPAFGFSQIRELTEIFVDKAVELRDVWGAEVTKKEGVARVDVLSWLSRMTLDVIGLAGFNYKFDALASDPESNELNKAFATLFKAGSKMTIIPIIRGLFPALRFLASQTMTRIGNQLIKDTKASIMAKGEPVERKTWRRRDLLSLLLRANMATDLPDSQRMSDEDVLAQVPTFLVAGHETTSTGTTWALYALTQAPRVQDKLRQELLGVSSDNPTMDELNALPYLDAVVRETLRVHAPVPSTIRVATKDDVIPLEKPVRDGKGKILDSISVRKGQTIFVPILAINRSADIWGEDSNEFKPERWESIPEAAGSIPGVWSNLLTFLGGPRACIGYRFTLIEMKALLFTLVRAFEFELAVPADDIKKRSSIVQRPILASDPDGGNQMPLLVKRYQRE
ncbi:hypothetical protein AMATHDRAFT_74271 [Amanita thiersii Skay4041]|uniref:Cytochrome P450 n=1 Tax=Amanita thiersii Skay4041 TaxID=703135 RepID=A0A2A9NW13_9AGAR|nr:hypothetical protein AMATHDRAFT_74271 [Amanita thiersii Skay4041]